MMERSTVETKATTTSELSSSEEFFNETGRSNPKPSWNRHVNRHRRQRSSQIGSSIFTNINTEVQQRKVQEQKAKKFHVFFPWSKYYKIWWSLTVLAASFTFFYETYQIAFAPGGLYPYDTSSTIISFAFIIIYSIDILIKFNLAYYDEKNEIVYNNILIAKRYLRLMFWVDLLAVLPFYTIVMSTTNIASRNVVAAEYLKLLKLLHLFRLYRISKLFENLQYNSRVSLLSLTLMRNFTAAMCWTHFAACVMYFIAKQFEFSNMTWIGQDLTDLSQFERYCTSLYWSIVTFTTVGYGDFSPVNAAEQIWAMIYMMMNIVFMSYCIGSITLLVVKNDEKTGMYRDTLQKLDVYSSINDFEPSFHRRLKKQLKLDFSNREISDDQVLQNFPSSVRRRVLRKLYLPSLLQSNLMKGVRQQFIDSLLVACTVEIFSPGEEFLQQGCVPSDLYLLVYGTVELTYECEDIITKARKVNSGDFINEVEFFTESPQQNSIRTLSVCKTLTLSRSAYSSIIENFPGSTSKILHNLLAKLEDMQNCSAFDSNGFSGSNYNYSARGSGNELALVMIQDLVKKHIHKHKDDQTTRFLFAASRDAIGPISLMCDQGFDPDSADYDARTALMVASMKGNVEAVSKLLEYGANPNLRDMHGTTALLEAVKNGHEKIIEMLLKHNASFCMDEVEASYTLCAAVYRGDILYLKRLLKARIDINASDYDKRTAIHIAAAEGNITAFKVLVEFGADIKVCDRWNNSVTDEAKRANATQIINFLNNLQKVRNTFMKKLRARKKMS